MSLYDFHSLEGLARSLNGTTDYFSRASEAALNPGANDFAIAAYVYLDAIGAGSRFDIVSKIGAVGNYGYGLYVINGGGVTDARLWFSSDGSNFSQVAPGVNLLSAAAWHFLCAWYDASAGTLYAQVDNGTIYSQAGLPNSVFASTAALNVGSSKGTVYFLDGCLAKIGLWIGSFPTAGQRTAVYNGVKGLTRYALTDDLLDYLVLWLDGDEASGNLLDGFAGYDMTATGTPGSAAGPDAADALSLIQTRQASWPVKGAPIGNVALSRTPGGRLRSQERGEDGQLLVLHLTDIPESQWSALMTWFATFGSGRRPYLLELADGSRLRVRWIARSPEWTWNDAESYDVTVEMVADIL